MSIQRVRSQTGKAGKQAINSRQMFGRGSLDGKPGEPAGQCGLGERVELHVEKLPSFEANLNLDLGARQVNVFSCVQGMKEDPGTKLRRRFHRSQFCANLFCCHLISCTPPGN